MLKAQRVKVPEIARRLERHPTISRTRPVYVMFDADVEEWEAQAVFDGLSQVMIAAGTPSHMKVHNLGVWRSRNWLDRDGYLAEWSSVDWYIAYTQRNSRQDQLHGGKLLKLLFNEPWQESAPHYDIVVTAQDLYDDDCGFCIGLAVPGFGTVISTNRFRSLSAQDAYNCIVTETMHEVGHVFGLVPETRTTNMERSLGLHCTNRCIMRQGLRVPYDWQVITADRLQGHGFCGECSRDLRRYFRQ